MMTASNLKPGMRMTTSKMGWDPAPDNVQHTISDFSKHTLTLISERLSTLDDQIESQEVDETWRRRGIRMNEHIT
jgi:hypothetical protein